MVFCYKDGIFDVCIGSCKPLSMYAAGVFTAAPKSAVVKPLKKFISNHI